MPIRLAKPTDASAILSIYAPYIEQTSLTFELEVPTEQEFADRIAHYLHTWPWLVFEKDGIIGGYAYASLYRERKGYQWCCECSIYIRDEYKRTGMAKILYETLFAILEKQGYRNVYAVINLPNDTSVAFHEKCGFTYFASYENVGFKLGKWKTVGWWQLRLNSFDDDPLPPIPFAEMDQQFVSQLLSEQSAKLKE